MVEAELRQVHLHAQTDTVLAKRGFPPLAYGVCLRVYARSIAYAAQCPHGLSSITNSFYVSRA